MTPVQFKGDDVTVGRILHEDDDFMTLEVIKNENIELQLDPEVPDKFLTLVFVRMENGKAEVWKPW